MELLPGCPPPPTSQLVSEVEKREGEGEGEKR